MYVTSTIRVNDFPLEAFRKLLQLEESRLVVGDNFIWIHVGYSRQEAMFFLDEKDSATYRKEIGEEEE